MWWYIEDDRDNVEYEDEEGEEEVVVVKILVMDVKVHLEGGE